MSLLRIWIVESKHIDPNDFYVQVDQSKFYTAYWALYTTTKDVARLLVLEASDDLDLGKTEICDIRLYDPKVVVESEIVRLEIDDAIKTYMGNEEKIRMAAWTSENGNLC